MLNLLLAAALVFQHEPPPPKPTLEVGHNVWVLSRNIQMYEQVDDWGEITEIREVRRDGVYWVEYKIRGQKLEWTWRKDDRMRRIGDK